MILTDSEVASLKSALGCWEWLEYVSTAIVFLGCVGEFVAEFTSLPKSEKTEKKLARLSLIILIFGIAGELLGTVRTSQLSGQLIANIDERAANENKLVAGLEQDVAKANTEMAKQQARAAEAERSLLALQEKIQPRHLSPEQRTAIKNALKRFPPQQVNILAFVGVSDGTSFGLELADAINSAGWKASFLGHESSGGELRGLALIMKDTKYPPLGARQLQDALKAAGLSAPAWNNPHWGGPESAISLLVAPKEM